MDTQPTQIAIPDTVQFADLRLARDADGMVSFNWQPIEAICDASNVSVELFQNAPEENVCALITTWYQTHLKRGGERDPVADDLIAEVLAEDAAGSLSHAPGRA